MGAFVRTAAAATAWQCQKSMSIESFRRHVVLCCIVTVDGLRIIVVHFHCASIRPSVGPTAYDPINVAFFVGPVCPWPSDDALSISALNRRPDTIRLVGSTSPVNGRARWIVVQPTCGGFMASIGPDVDVVNCNETCPCIRI